MKNSSQNRSLASSTTDLQVFVRFEVTITEEHPRTGTICDEQTGNCRYEFGSDFERAKHWLESDHTWANLGVFANEACGRWIEERGGRR